MKSLRVAFLLCLLPGIAFAAQAEGTPYGWLEPVPAPGKRLELKYGEEISIKGSNLLGKYDMAQGHPPKKEVCLVSAYSDYDRICVPHTDPRITRWTNNVITLNIPVDIYPDTKVRLRFQEYKEKCDPQKRGGVLCHDEWDWTTDIDIGTFIVKAVVESVSEKGGSITSLIIKGQLYTIHGKFFGQSQGRLFLNAKEMARSDVVKWLPDMVEIKATGAGTELEVDNGNGKVAFDLSDQKNQDTNSSQSNAGTSTGQSGTPFVDVASSHPYLPAIEWGKTSGVLSGYPDGTFHPDSPVNRAEFLKIIIEADSHADVPSATDSISFPDVDSNAWFAPYVRYAKQNNIVQGYPDGTFRPDKAVNFAEALKIAYEALGVTAESVGGEWYAKYLAHAKYNSALFTNEVDVGSDMTRKDVVWLVWKLTTMR